MFGPMPLLLAVYVDDIQVVGPTKEDGDAVYKELENHIKIEYKGPVRSLLGIDIIRNWDEHLIAINQSAHIDCLLGEFGLTNAKSVGSPLDPSPPLLAAMPGHKMWNIKYYRRLPARSIISLSSHALIAPSLSPNYLHSTQIQQITSQSGDACSTLSQRHSQFVHCPQTATWHRHHCEIL